MKSYSQLWARFLKHRKTHKRHGRICSRCIEMLTGLEEAAKRED
jgi:hypothetical protein